MYKELLKLEKSYRDIKGDYINTLFDKNVLQT